jgi:tetratricopeptide (TPR) repeat protein
MRRGSWATLGLSQSCLLAASVALAPVAALADDSTADYDSWVEQGLAAYAAADWQRAYSAFERANAVQPGAGVLRGMGVASYRLQRYPQALAFLEAALLHTTRPLGPELRSGVEKLVAELRARLGRYAINTNAPAVTLTVDGAVAPTDASGRLIVEAGKHVLSVSAPGYAPQLRELDTAAGTLTSLEIVLTPPVDAAAAAARVEQELIAPPARSDRDGRKLEPATSGLARRARKTDDSDFSYPVTLISAAAIPVFATATGLAWHRTQQIGDSLVEQCRKNECDEEQRADAIAQSPLRTFETLTDVGWALTGAAVVATGIAFVLESASTKGASSLEAGPLGSRWRVEF